MKINYLLLIGCLFVLACQSDKKEKQAQIQQLEAAAKENLDATKTDTLLRAYENYIAAYENDKEQIARYLSSAKNIMNERLTALRPQIFSETTGVIDQEAAQEFMNLAERHAALLPDDKQTPDWLFQAGELSSALHQYDKTLVLYEKINNEFTNYEKSSQVLFMRAFTLDSELKRFEEAKVLYQEFLKKYPKDDFADDTKFLLDNLGKSEEELIRAFQQKQEK